MIDKSLYKCQFCSNWSNGKCLVAETTDNIDEGIHYLENNDISLSIRECIEDGSDYELVKKLRTFMKSTIRVSDERLDECMKYLEKLLEERNDSLVMRLDSEVVSTHIMNFSDKVSDKKLLVTDPDFLCTKWR